MMMLYLGIVDRRIAEETVRKVSRAALRCLIF